MTNTAWLVPMHRLDRFDRVQQHQPALWRDEHTELVHA